MTFENPAIREEHDVPPWPDALEFAARVGTAKTLTLQRTIREAATVSELFWVHLFWLPVICALGLFPLALGLLAAINAWICPVPGLVGLSLVAAYLGGLYPALYKTHLIRRCRGRKRHVRHVDLTIDFERQALIATATYQHFPLRSRQERISLRDLELACEHHSATHGYGDAGIDAHCELYLIVRGSRPRLRQRWVRERLARPVQVFSHNERITGAREACAENAAAVASAFRSRVCRSLD